MTLIEALNLAIQHFNQGRGDECERICRVVLANLPDQPDAAHLLALVESGRDRIAPAFALLRRALALRPEFADAHGNLGVLQQRSGRPTDAIVALGRAIRLRPSQPEAYSNRGSARLDAGDRAGAIEDFVTAAGLRPAFTQALVNLGIALRLESRMTEAITVHRRAVALEPAHAEAWVQLGHAQREGGQLVQARDAYARALDMDPARTDALGYMLYLKQCICDWRDFDALSRRVCDAIDRDAGIVIPLATLSIDTTIAQQLRSARLFYRSAVRRSDGDDAPPPPRAPSTGRLRVAYASADFHEHATAYLTAELFERHDRGRFEIAAYSYGPDDGSPMRRRLVAAFDRFRDIRSLGVDGVARLAAEDGIDILIDVKTYTKGARLDLLSRRLAPVQATWLAYPGAMGGGFMDYIIGDPVVTPMEHQPFYTERIVQLPDSYQSNDRRRAVADRTPTRAECGLPDDAFVYCCFNTAYKILPDAFALWMRLLARTPGSVLWLYRANPVAEENLRRAAAAAGVDPSRLVFAPNRPLAEHLARYRVADLFIDSFPYTAHTTGSDALWVGLPVVTRCGDTFASRVGASLLRAVGLPELITRSAEEFEALALRLAADRALLAGLRRRLEETRLSVPLFDSARFTRHMEAAFETMWRIHASGRPPESFAVPAQD